MGLRISYRSAFSALSYPQHYIPCFYYIPCIPHLHPCIHIHIVLSFIDQIFQINQISIVWESPSFSPFFTFFVDAVTEFRIRIDIFTPVLVLREWKCKVSQQSENTCTCMCELTKALYITCATKTLMCASRKVFASLNVRLCTCELTKASEGATKAKNSGNWMLNIQYVPHLVCSSHRNVLPTMDFIHHLHHHHYHH